MARRNGRIRGAASNVSVLAASIFSSPAISWFEKLSVAKVPHYTCVAKHPDICRGVFENNF
jgi:hypothetical protein